MDYWLVTAGPDDEPGINGAITPRTTRGQATICSMSTTSVDESARKVVDAGGSVIMQKATVSGVGYLIMCKDTEGNVFGIIELDPLCKIRGTGSARVLTPDAPTNCWIRLREYAVEHLTENRSQISHC